MRTYYLIFFLGIIVPLKSLTIYYTVTTTVFNAGPGSLSYILGTAISDVNNPSGNHVIINFNAPGLIDMPVTGISHAVYISLQASATGTLTFQKSSSATTIQGFQGSETYGGFSIVNPNASSKIEFIDLEFRTFTFCMWTQPSNNLNIQSCNFQDCSEAIHVQGGQNFTINGCTFSESASNSSILDGGIHILYAGKGSITNCQFSAGTLSSDNYRGISMMGCGINYSITCTGNSFTSLLEGIYYAVEQGYNATNFYFNFSNNTFSNNTNHFHISNPFKYSIIDNNTFSSAKNNDFFIDCEFSNLYNCGFFVPTIGLGLDFISTNSMGIPVFNGSNIFNGSSSPLYRSFKIYSSSGGCLNEVRIIGLTLPGRITVEGITPATIKETKINTNVSMLPIDLMGNISTIGNGGIDAPIISSSTIDNTATNFSVDYYLTGNQHNNAPLTVEFYKCNLNGDLIEFLAKQVVTSATSGVQTFNHVFVNPLTSGEIVAFTVSNYFGTSEVNYIIPCGDFRYVSECVNSPVTFSTGICAGTPTLLTWEFGDGTAGNGLSTSHMYASPGVYPVKLKVDYSGLPSQIFLTSVNVTACEPIRNCNNCIGSFAPDPGNYVLSLWVKEDINPLPLTFSHPKVEISFIGNPTVYSFGTNNTKNKIIEGWQRIEELFTIPLGATHLNLKLENQVSFGSPAVNAYFDDIRILPKDGQMKSYVYDPITLKLSAVLDENNYATFYEYDEEGKLLRVKKETEKGIMTVQENRESLKKK